MESSSAKAGYGRRRVDGVVRWTPSGDAAQTLTEADGVDSVTRTGAGAWTIQLSDEESPSIEAWCQCTDNGTTHYHFLEVEEVDQANHTIKVRHRSCAFADVATGPTASDTVDEVAVFFSSRVSW